MDISDFWRLIDKTREQSGSDGQHHRELLIIELAYLSVEEIIEFESIFTDLSHRAYNRDLWNAAYIIGCGCSDDGFSDFRGWLIGQGQIVYENALQNPESLADIVEIGVDTQNGIWWGVILDAYERKTGQEMPMTLLKPQEHPLLSGDTPLPGSQISEAEWEQQIKRKFSKLDAKFGDCAGFLNALS